jgi:hypothetical protein
MILQMGMAILSTSLMATPAPAQTAISAAVAADDPATLLGEASRLLGQGRYTFLSLPIYDAKLWAGKNFDPQLPTDSVFALELTYARGFKGRAIAERSMAEIAKLGLVADAQRERWLTELSRMIPDVAGGDRLVGLWRPGQGMSLVHNGRPIAQSGDLALGKAFFAIWLHPDTSAPRLRQALLAGAVSAKTAGSAAATTIEASR